MSTATPEWGVQQKRVPVVEAVLNQGDAEEYLGVSNQEMMELIHEEEIPIVSVPRSYAPSLFRVEDLDRYLAEKTDRYWRPRPRLGDQAELYVRQAATFLGLSKAQVYSLSQKGEIPHEGGGRGTAYRFRVGELRGCLKRWRR